MKTDSYYERVLKGEIEVEVVLETENILAFYHTQPIWAVHIVVIPKVEVDSLMQLKDNDLILEMTKSVKVVATFVKEKHGAANVLTNLGEYQSDNRLLWHVYYGDKLEE
ncbi:MAG: HIT domain-containing protein [Microscillaceae bacterium]|nr:HIT domain-containing protein [Microscillaceae bacterium]